VELFFNEPLVPAHRRVTLYTYHVITVPAHYQIVADATQTVQQVECSTDFLGQLRLFLNRGWKLVDICIDSTAIADGRTMSISYLLVPCNHVSLSNVSSFFSFILFLCLACIFCVPFVYLSNVCSFSLLFSYVIVLARLSQVLLHIKINK